MSKEFRPAAIKQTISFAEFNRIDIRVGTINLVEDVAGSDKLLKLTVDFGDHCRSILAGMKQERANPREIEGRQALFVVNLEPKYPASRSSADLQATKRADAYMNRQYLDPVFLARYPEEMSEIFGEAWPEWSDDDMQLIAEPIDFLGVNYYTRKVERFHPEILESFPRES